MNDKISADEFRKSLDHHLSGLKADPWLAQRIIASEKGEEPMKKKSALSLALVLIMLFSVTAAAFAATEVYKIITINQKGEVVVEPDTAILPEPTQTPASAAEVNAASKVEEFLSDAPEDQYAQAYIDCSGGSKEPQRTIETESEFNAAIDGCAYLTRPAVPEGYRFDRAVLFLGCDEAGDYLPEELREDEGGYYARYSVSAGAEAVTGYDVTYRDGEGKFINIYDRLSEYTEGDERLFAFPEGYSYHSLDVPGMEYSISVEGSKYSIHMMRALDNPIVCRW